MKQQAGTLTESPPRFQILHLKISIIDIDSKVEIQSVRHGIKYFNGSKKTVLLEHDKYISSACMDKNDHKRQQRIFDMLTFKGGASPANIADHELRLWEQLAAQLSPLIGETGFCALYGRAVRLTAEQFEWLTPPQSSQSVHAIFTLLRENFASVDLVIAGKANVALLNTFIKLLSGLIGEALTNRVLDTAWSGDLEKKNAQEHK